MINTSIKITQDYTYGTTAATLTHTNIYKHSHERTHAKIKKMYGYSFSPINTLNLFKAADESKGHK